MAGEVCGRRVVKKTVDMAPRAVTIARRPVDMSGDMRTIGGQDEADDLHAVGRTRILRAMFRDLQPAILTPNPGSDP